MGMIKIKGGNGRSGWEMQEKGAGFGFRNLRLNNLLVRVSEIKKSHVVNTILLRALV